MFDATIQNIEADKVMRYRLQRDGAALTFADVLTLWHSDSSFCHYYTAILAASPFGAYRWETPSLTTATVNQPFEFILLNSPSFCSRKTDRRTFSSYFTTDDTDHGIVSFANLNGDATLIIPSPRTDISAYGHLAAFIRNAPKNQIEAFWRILSNTVVSKLSRALLWLSTAGGGVAWLHVRLDSRPKYYGYAPYKTA